MDKEKRISDYEMSEWEDILAKEGADRGSINHSILEKDALQAFKELKELRKDLRDIAEDLWFCATVMSHLPDRMNQRDGGMYQEKVKRLQEKYPDLLK